MNVYDQKGKQVHLGESVGRGGEATVYRVNGRPGQLAKIYEPAPRANYPQKLAWMLDHPPENPTQALSHPSLAWPNSLLLNTGRRLVGYQMPFIQMAVPILDVFNPRRRAEMLPKFDSRYLHRTARNLAAALNALHESGYVAGDLNESNVLVTPSALVTLIDTDSFQVEEQRDSRAILHPCPVGKLEYTPPELQNKPLGMFHRLPEQDSFGLGVLIFQLLMEGNHPFRAQWLGGGDPPPVEARIAQGAFPYTASPSYPVRPPKNAPDLNTLHPEIAELVRRCFVDGAQKPNLRPSPGMWERAIAEAEKVLVPCPRGHFYSNHLQSCPVCPPVQTRPSSAPRPAAGAGKPTQDPATRPARPPFPTGSPARNGPARNPGTAQSPTRPIPRPAANPRPAGRSPGGNPVGSRQQSGRPQPSPWVYRRPSGSALSSAWKFITTTSSLIRSIQAWQTAGAGPVQAQSRPSAQNASPSASQSGPNQGSQPGRSPHQASPGGSTGPRAWQAAPAGGGAATWSPAAPWGWPRPAPYGQVSVSRTQSQPSVSWSLVRVKIFKSLLVGGGLGALAGAVPGAVVGVASWSAGTTAALALLWALGGATAGILRGWRPGYRLSQWVSRTVGWQRVWPVAGLALGALIGTLIGLVLGWWAIFPIFLGLFLGARLGLAGGRKLWQAGNRLGWERIWAVVGAGSAALLGWVLARWVSATVLGSLDDQFAGSLASWIMGHSTSWPLVWTVVGALCGSLGGAVAGTISDLFARFSGLID